MGRRNSEYTEGAWVTDGIVDTTECFLSKVLCHAVCGYDQKSDVELKMYAMRPKQVTGRAWYQSWELIPPRALLVFKTNLLVIFACKSEGALMSAKETGDRWLKVRVVSGWHGDAVTVISAVISGMLSN